MAAESLLAVLLAVLGGLLGAIILYAEPKAPDLDFALKGEGSLFIRRPEAQLWLALIIGEVALLTLLACVAVDLVRSVGALQRPGALVAAAVMVGLVVYFLYKVSDAFGAEPPLPWFDAKIDVLTLLGAAVVALALASAWALHADAEQALAARPGRDADGDWLRTVTRSRIGDLAPEASAADAFLRARELLQRSLLVQGLVIGAAILGAAGLRNAVVAHYDARTFPYEHVLLYGLFFSALLALFFVPTFVRLNELGRAIRDALVPAPGPHDDDPVRVYRERAELTKLLGLEATATSTFRAGVAILAPFGTSLLGTLLEL